MSVDWIRLGIDRMHTPQGNKNTARSMLNPAEKCIKRDVPKVQITTLGLGVAEEKGDIKEFSPS